MLRKTVILQTPKVYNVDSLCKPKARKDEVFPFVPSTLRVKDPIGVDSALKKRINRKSVRNELLIRIKK